MLNKPSTSKGYQKDQTAPGTENVSEQTNQEWGLKTQKSQGNEDVCDQMFVWLVK